jgi:hypothetical protein
VGKRKAQMDMPRLSLFQHRFRRVLGLRTANVAMGLAAIFFTAASPLTVIAKEKDGIPYGEGLIVNVPFPESEVAQVIQEVVQNGIIRGTKEYNKDEYVTGATAAPSVKVFPKWIEPGEVFYKVREHTLDPRNFKDSGDIGTLAVRYVLQPQGLKNTVLRINAVFVEDFRHTVHLSNGSVEGAEYKNIHDHLDEIAVMKSQTQEALREQKALREQQAQHASTPVDSAPVEMSSSANSPTTQTEPAETAPAETTATKALVATGAENQLSPSSTQQTDAVPPTLENKVKDLRRQVERLVKPPGAALRSAPFHTATALQSLPAGTEVLVVITTPYWLGIETHDGQHGWMLRDDLELLP